MLDGEYVTAYVTAPPGTTLRLTAIMVVSGVPAAGAALPHIALASLPRGAVTASSCPVQATDGYFEAARFVPPAAPGGADANCTFSVTLAPAAAAGGGAGGGGGDGCSRARGCWVRCAVPTRW